MTTHYITPHPGFAPTIGRLVSMLSYARQTLLEAVEGPSRDELDHLHDATSNTIGALLGHAAAVERWYQILTFEDRRPSASEEAAWCAAPEMNAHWAWFHVAEDEISHRGQIRWLRARLHRHHDGGATSTTR